VISSLRGRCPRPLDECAALHYSSKSSQSSQIILTKELFQRFLESRPPGISDRTIEAYHYTLDRFVGRPVTPESINQYLRSLKCRNGKLKFYSCLRALCNWLHQNEYIMNNPIQKLTPPKKQQRILSSINRDQLETLVNHCRCERDSVLISFLWYSGVRLSEATNVKTQDFNWDEGTVIVLGKGNKYRKALAGNGLVKEWFSKHNTFEISRGGIQTMLKRLARETRIQCNAHSFRRGFCVHQVRSGLSTRVTQALGGWESISMVERYSKSLTFDDAVSVYLNVNGNSEKVIA